MSRPYDPDAMLRFAGANIRRLRCDQAWTAGELAARAKVDEAMIEAMDEGRVNLDIDLLAELADALNMEAYVLVAPPAPADR